MWVLSVLQTWKRLWLVVYSSPSSPSPFPFPSPSPSSSSLLLSSFLSSLRSSLPLPLFPSPPSNQPPKDWMLLLVIAAMVVVDLVFLVIVTAVDSSRFYAAEQRATVGLSLTT